MSFPRYPKYKDSGVEWLGEVPEHWQVVPIKYLTRLCGGGTPSRTNLAYWDGAVPWASAKDLKSQVLADTEDHLTRQAIDDGAASLVAAESLLVVVRGMILVHTFPVVKALVPMAINQDLKAILPTPQLNVDFLACLLRGSAQETISRIDEAGHGTKALRMDAWTSMCLPVPPRDEQTRIAAFLDRETAKIDALVAEQRRLIELLKEKRQAVISHAVTKGLNPRARMKPSGIEWLGEVPEHWDIIPFARAIDFQEGPGIMAVDFHEVGVPLLRVAGVQGRWATLQGCNFLDPERVAKQWSHFRLKVGDLVISASATMGTVCEVRSDVEGAIPYTGLIRLTGKRGIMKRDFIRAVLASSLFSTQIDLFKAGTTIQHFGPTHLRLITIFRPPVTEQEQIATYIDQQNNVFDALTAEAQRAVDLLQERRTALISAAVTGKIDVRGLAQSEAA